MGGGYYEIITGMDVRGMTDENNRAVNQRIDAACTAATRDQLEEWLATLEAGLAGGRGSRGAVSLKLDLYAGALSRYPADVARAAIFSFLAPCKDVVWFPGLPQLLDRADKLFARRRHLAEAVRWAA